MASRQAAISGGRKLKVDSQSGWILERTVHAMQKRRAGILVRRSESQVVKLEAITGASRCPRTSKAAWLTFSTFMLGGAV